MKIGQSTFELLHHVRIESIDGTKDCNFIIKSQEIEKNNYVQHYMHRAA